MTHREIIHFISEHIIYRFGISQTLITDQGSSFMSHQVHEFVESLKIKLLSSSAYYAQPNGWPSLVIRLYQANQEEDRGESQDVA
jgi:hypothetical protein